MTILTLNATTENLIRLWNQHRAQGKTAGYDRVHEWGAAPESEHLKADEWARIDQGFRTVIGAQLIAAILRTEGDTQ